MSAAQRVNPLEMVHEAPDSVANPAPTRTGATPAHNVAGRIALHQINALPGEGGMIQDDPEISDVASSAIACSWEGGVDSLIS